MTLEEEIQHCEEVVEKYDELYRIRRTEWEKITCRECADEHRQLADWLKELKRARYLLAVTYDLLRKQEESYYVLNLLSETIFYDEAECDGNCLMEDIENLLEYGV